MTATLQASDVVQDSKGWFYRVRADGDYDSFSEFDEGIGTPVVTGDAVSWPVQLLVRDGKPATDDPSSGLSVRMALFLAKRR